MLKSHLQKFSCLGKKRACNSTRVVPLDFSAYEHDARFYDEMFRHNGKPRAHCHALYRALQQLSAAEIADMQARAARSFNSEGITFTVYGDGEADEHIIPIDCLPRLLTAKEWQGLEAGLTQRLQALNLFLQDIYHEARIVADGVVPADMVRGCSHYRIAMRGVNVPHNTWVTICGTDIVRTNDGFFVLEDNLRVPSGVAYMIANRKVIKANLRYLYRSYKVQEVEHYGTMLRNTLVELSDKPDPCIVLLTPGVYNAAFYEHIFLAQEIGAELVEGQDLLVSNGKVYMRTTSGLRQVDVIYRRIDDDFIDPLAFRPDSVLGVPGLLHAFKLGNVALANVPGSGVADDKSVYAYVPDMIRYYLHTEPLLANVKTYLCRRPDDLTYTLDNIAQLVVKRVDGAGGYGMLVGPHASAAERDAFIKQLQENPSHYIAQPTLNLSRSPCVVETRAEPRHVDLRPFVLHGQQTRIVPGAFCRVALRKGSLVVNSSQGGGGKDLWVLEQ